MEILLGYSVGSRQAPVAELVDAQDLKSCLPKGEYGFDSRLGHESPSAMLRGFCIWERCERSVPERSEG